MSDPQSRLGNITGIVIVLLANFAMLAWTWQRCPEPVTDFGREIYIPWRISAASEVLYRDLNSFNGPLSPYFNATVFRLTGGASLRTLKITNAVVALACAIMIYAIVRELAGALAAVACGIVQATVFSFAHLRGGNFNFLTPYSHDLTHGIVLSLAMLMCLSRATGRAATRWLALGGLILGLVLLTKAEVALASILAAAGALLLLTRGEWRARVTPRNVAIVVGATLVAPISAVLLLSGAMPVVDGFRSVAGAWLWVADPTIVSLPFFKWVTGTDVVGTNLSKIIGWLAAYIAVFATAVMAGALVPQRRHKPLIVGIVAGAVLAAAIAWWWRSIPWGGILRPMPILLLVALIWWLLQLRARWLARHVSRRDLLGLSFCIFALALLAKISLNVQPSHYGFALAMPGAMVLVMIFVSWMPERIDARGGSGVVVRSVAICLLTVIVGVHLKISGARLTTRTFDIGTGADHFRADATGAVVERARQRLAELARRGDTLLVVPEGAMLNYLLRLRAGSRYVNFLPSEVQMYGEASILNGLRRDPPTFVAVVHRRTEEYGARDFGKDYARELAQWIVENYNAVGLEEAMPFESDDFGVLVLRRRGVD